MARILVITSSIAHGSVGLAAISPALNICGFDVTAIPTILLSNHPGFEIFAGESLAPAELHRMLDALNSNGWLSEFSGILTGYLPSEAHVAFAKRAAEKVRRANPDAIYICDPVLGDHPKGVYIDISAAERLRDDLIPIADTILPNAFELGWLTGRDTQSVNQALSAMRELRCARVVAKSIPASNGRLANLELSEDQATAIIVNRRRSAPNGTGDFLSALIAAGWPIARATAALEVILDQSAGQVHLAIVASRAAWLRTPPCERIQL